MYLGDLGRDLPAAEWGHWKSYNVPPQGTMDEGRFRRDFLSQFASSKDPAGDLQRARARAAEVSEALAGSPIWRPLPADARAEFESLVGPLSDAPAALGQALLVLTKAGGVTGRLSEGAPLGYSSRDGARRYGVADLLAHRARQDPAPLRQLRRPTTFSRSL